MKPLDEPLTWFVALFFLLLPSSEMMVGSSSPTAPTDDYLCLSEIIISTPLPYDEAEVAAARRKAESAREAIRQGASFADTAKKFSDGPSAANGGELGFFKHGQLAKSIEDKVFAMKVGDVSDVIRTKQGFAILKVTECGLPTGMRGASGSVEIIGGTQGIDFGPYIRRITKQINENWYSQIPASAQDNNGEVTIECAITADGNLTNSRLVAGSGNEVLDRAAWRGLELSSPFPRLPSHYTGPILTLRLHFHYNPIKNVLK
jgi:TonB family protein